MPREVNKEQIHQSADTPMDKAGFLCKYAETLTQSREASHRIGQVRDGPRVARHVLVRDTIVADALGKAPTRFTLHPTSPG